MCIEHWLKECHGRKCGRGEVVSPVVKQSPIQAQIFALVVLFPWASYATSLSLGFFICKMKPIVVYTEHGYYRDDVNRPV